MKKLFILLGLTICLFSVVYSQSEQIIFQDNNIEKTYTVTVTTISDGESFKKVIDYRKIADDYLKSKKYVYQNIYGEKKYDDFDKSKTIGWNFFNQIYSYSGIGMGFMTDALDVESLGGVNSIMGNIGNSLALIQIGSDIYKEKKFNAMSGTAKTSMFYVIGTYGWKALKISSYGMQILDIMLTELGKYAVSSKYKNLRDPYFAYYSGRSNDGNAPKRSLKEWKTLFEAAENEAEIKKIIDKRLDAFFRDDALNKKINYRHYDKKEQEAVKKEYYESQLLPYLKPVFSRMAYEARLEKILDIYKGHKKAIGKLNTWNKYYIQVNASPDELENCRVAIQVMGDKGKKLFVKGRPDTDGRCRLRLTKYSLAVHGVEKARAVLRISDEKGVRYKYQPIDLKQSKMYINFNYSHDEWEDEEDREPENQPEYAEQGMEPEGEIQPEQGSEKALIPELKENMKAVLTINGKAMVVKLKNVKVSPASYTATLKHKKLPKGNLLTLGRTTGAMNFVYKLKGPFAPELICRSPLPVNGAYTGLIVTNNEAAVKVGAFTLKF